LRRELLDEVGEFADVPAAQAAIDAWVHAYNHSRPHQSLDMAVPASLFRPALSQLAEPGTSNAVEPATPLRLPSEQPREEQPAEAAAETSTPPQPASPDAVEFERLVPVSGYLGVLPRVQRIRLDKDLAGRIAEGPTPPPPAGPISVTRRVPRDGVVMVTRQRLRVGATHAGQNRHHPRRRHPLPGPTRRRGMRCPEPSGQLPN
jgi:hypothetical protein